MQKEDLKRFWSFEEVDRIPFLPLVCSLAARIEAVSIKTMLNNPTKMANSLQKTQRLFGYDGIFNIIDSSLEAEACGCQLNWDDENKMPQVVSHPLAEGKTSDQLPLSNIEKMGRIPIVLEVTKRLSAVMGNNVDIIGALTGPLTLARCLAGESLVKDLKNDFNAASSIISAANTVVMRLGRLYCENRVDGIWVFDNLIAELDSETLQRIMPFYRSLFNVTNFFNVYLIISAGAPPVEIIEAIFKLNATGFIISGVTEIDNFLQIAAGERKHLGIGIPNSVWLESPDLIRETVRNLTPASRRGFFFTTEEQVPYTMPVENMHEFMKVLNEN